MDKTTTLMFRAACAVVIGWGVVNTINFTRSALADRQAALERAEEERRVAERWAEQQRQAAVERAEQQRKRDYVSQLRRCNRLYFGESDSPKQLKKCREEVKAKFPEQVE